LCLRQHLRTDHPDLVDKVSDEQILDWLRSSPDQSVGRRPDAHPSPAPWESFVELVEPQSDRDYILLLAHLPVRRLSKLPLFLR